MVLRTDCHFGSGRLRYLLRPSNLTHSLTDEKHELTPVVRKGYVLILNFFAIA